MEKCINFKLTDLPIDKFSVLLKEPLQKELIDLSLISIGKEKDLTTLLKSRCNSLKNLKSSSINNSYLLYWKKSKKFIPIDCLIELSKLANYSPEDIVKNITRLKFKHQSNKHSKNVNEMLELFEFKKDLEYFKEADKFDFAEKFFGITFSEYDKIEFRNFLMSIKMRTDGKTNKEISNALNMPKKKIDNWIFLKSFPTIVRFIKLLKTLGEPGNEMKWLSINSTKGGLFIGPWIRVPDKISSIEDVIDVINQLKPSEEFYKGSYKFGLSNNLDIRSKMFAFLLGMLVGDASKHGIQRKNRITRRITVRLTKKHLSDEVLGEFTSLCVNALGLRMNKCKDCPPGKRNTFPFYTWISQSSPLFEWIFTECLGLETHQLTTYDPINANWILYTPLEFRKWFIQGLVESDGYVDFNSFQVGIISQPNTHLIKNIVESFGIKSSIKLFRDDLEAVVVSVEDAYNQQLFSPIVSSYRYKQAETLATTEKLNWHISEELKQKIETLLRSGLKGSSLIKELLYKEKIRVRPKVIRRLQRELEVTDEK